ncbi:hypothetical protein LV82_00359 [Albidovulum inexpectatum]|uniref:Uncharacterized protein n=1 Tax=Albidovulum inexpectatum TaxID=196587 RepID=A0A2S5JLR6_9RHOB|nr:hypothetical protein [Albidovulum inexpectatum]PPB82429.1 hypothetical protein LV82_00359 [Albidovulum inexpectatum]
MAEKPRASQPGPAHRVDLALNARPPSARRRGAAELIAAALSLLWLVMSGGFLWVSGGQWPTSGTLVMVIVTIVVPIVLIWTAALTLRTAREMRDEAARLQAALDAMRHAWLEQMQTHSLRPVPGRSMQGSPSSPSAPAKPRVSGQAPMPPKSAASPAASQAAPEGHQKSLALRGPDAPAAPIALDDFIVALNFPESGDDAEGFRALRRALDDPRAARLIRAAHDVLTLLSQDGLYMDDMRADPARPELWRRFANGERGRSVADLGGIRDKELLEKVSARLRKDAIFRDVAHHFLRQFDQALGELEPRASDRDLITLSQTRTARAFMLIARAIGTFD